MLADVGSSILGIQQAMHSQIRQCPQPVKHEIRPEQVCRYVLAGAGLGYAAGIDCVHRCFALGWEKAPSPIVEQRMSVNQLSLHDQKPLGPVLRYLYRKCSAPTRLR
jgi:hypothetical protein